MILVPSQDMRHFCLYLHQMVQHSKQVASRMHIRHLKEGVPLPLQNLAYYFSSEVLRILIFLSILSEVIQRVNH